MNERPDKVPPRLQTEMNASRDSSIINPHASVRRIVLIGMPGTGKSTVAGLLSSRLGWMRGDTDDLIVSLDGRPIPVIFRDEGEPYFRKLERQAVAQLSKGDNWVVATGGGVVLDPVNRERLWRDSFVVHLQAGLPTLLARTAAAHGPGATERPLLAGDDLAARLTALWTEREPLYALADWSVGVDVLTAADVAEEIERAWQRWGTQLVARSGRLHDGDAAFASAAVLPGGSATPTIDTEQAADPNLAARITTPAATYAAYAGWAILDQIPTWMREAGLGSSVHIIADARVAGLHGEALIGALRAGGLETHLHALDLDEGRKSLAAAELVFDRLVERRAERKHVVLAFGGGVATDLGGFVAATYLRGLPLVHVPTSLLGMVDAAVGGKVAVNHRSGKNLIGAFYQPALVVADAALLPTLPPRELTSGWGEVIKHALIADLELLGWLEDEAEAMLALEPQPAARMLRRNIAIKAAVVSADERESGLRMTLNYGHTTGHALEAATGYEALLHGEAVAVGMVAAAHIGRTLGLLTADEEARQNRLIARYGLPLRAPGIDVTRVLAAMSLDKKVSRKALRWVLLDGLGRTVIRDDVPLPLVREAVELVTSAELSP